MNVYALSTGPNSNTCFLSSTVEHFASKNSQHVCTHKTVDIINLPYIHF